MLLVITLMTCLLQRGQASLALWIPPDEVINILGVPRELSYISGGVFRRSAIAFALPIAEHHEQNIFKWKNDDKQKQIFYSMVLWSSDHNSLHQPHLNVSHQGVVPNSETTWRVTMPCTGKKTAEVEVKIQIQFKGGLEENIELTRLKKCHAVAPISSSNHKVVDPGRTEPHLVFVAILLASLGVILLLSLVIVSVHWRRRQLFFDGNCDNNKVQSSLSLNYLHQPLIEQQQMMNMNAYGGSQAMAPPPLPSNPPPPLPPPNPPSSMLYARAPPPGQENAFLSDAESRVTDWVQSHRKPGSSHVETDPEQAMKILHIERLRLKLGQLLQEGTFGRIYQGTLLNEDELEEDIVIKTVIAGSSPAQSHLLIKEGTALHGMTHHNIQCLLATTFDGTSPMLVYPYMAFGNLKKWLQQPNHGGCSSHIIVNMGLQLLKAIQYLHKKKIIHKDIATRNCYLGEGNVLKLSDSALSRDLFPSDYHCLGDNENRPIKWMPMEAIAQKSYSRSSDVWSFGVFLWELMTRAQQPFSDIDPFEMEAYLFEGFRLHQPLNCPDQLYTVLTLCWGARPMERASVHNLYGQLQNLQKQLQQFV